MNDSGPYFYLTERGIPLAFTGKPRDRIVLTCELHTKWYALYIVEPGGHVNPAPISIDDLEKYNDENESVVGDHCWNPKILRRYAEAQRWEIDELSFDLIAGRWYNSRDDTPDALAPDAIETLKEGLADLESDRRRKSN